MILPIKEYWFDKIIAGVKPEKNTEKLKNIGLNGFGLGNATNKICEVIFKNGYTANAPTCRCKSKHTYRIWQGRMGSKSQIQNIMYLIL